MDDQQLHHLAQHIAENYSLGPIAMKTQNERKADNEQFTPLDTTDLIETYQALHGCRTDADSAGMATPEHRFLFLIGDDGEQLLCKASAAKPEDWNNTLMVAAAEVSALQNAVSDAITYFVSLARQADAAKEAK